MLPFGCRLDLTGRSCKQNAWSVSNPPRDDSCCKLTSPYSPLRKFPAGPWYRPRRLADIRYSYQQCLWIINVALSTCIWISLLPEVNSLGPVRRVCLANLSPNWTSFETKSWSALIHIAGCRSSSKSTNAWSASTKVGLHFGSSRSADAFARETRQSSSATTLISMVLGWTAKF